MADPQQVPAPPVSDHLVFFIHGMGQQRGEYGHLEHHVSTMQRNTDHLLRIFYPDKAVRVKYVAIEWHSKIQYMVADKVALSTLKTVPKVRLMTNEWLADVLYYFTKPHGQHIISTICDQLIEAYDNYTIIENPDFCANGGQVHIIGFSLGGICAYDILANQPTARSTLSALDDTGFIVPALPFTVRNLFTAGSPIAATLIARNQSYTTYSPSESTRVHNIFHPFDPLGYRIEPMMDERYAGIPPVVLERLGRRRILPVSVSLPNLKALKSIPGAAGPLIMQARRSFFRYMTSRGTYITSTEEETIVEETRDGRDGRPVRVLHRRNSSRRDIMHGLGDLERDQVPGGWDGSDVEEEGGTVVEAPGEVFEGLYVEEEETTTRTSQTTTRKAWIGSFYRPSASAELAPTVPVIAKRPVSPQTSQESIPLEPFRRRLNSYDGRRDEEEGLGGGEAVGEEEAGRREGQSVSPEPYDSEEESGRRTPQPRQPEKRKSTILGMAGSVAGSVANGVLSVVGWPTNAQEKTPRARTRSGDDDSEGSPASRSPSPRVESLQGLSSSPLTSDSEEPEMEEDVSLFPISTGGHLPAQPEPTPSSSPRATRFSFSSIGPGSPTRPSISRSQSLDSLASYTTAMASPLPTPHTAASVYEGLDFPEIELGASFLGELDGPIPPSPHADSFTSVSAPPFEKTDPPVPREETEDWTRRLDFVLTEGYVDAYANEWIVAMKSHFRYWANRDFTYHMIKTMVGSKPTVPVVGMAV